MKKLLVLLILAALIGSSISTFAASKPPKIIDYTQDTPDINGSVAREAESRVNSRLLLPPYNINMSVPAFSQNDLRWKNNTMQTTGQTIGNAGCTLTSCTMVAAYYGKNTDPGVFNTDMGNSACPLIWADVVTKGGVGYISSLNTLRSNPSLNTFFNLARVAMEQDHPVVLGFVQTNGRTHYVLVKAVFGQGTSLTDYGCIDPNTGGYRNLADVIGSQPLYKIAIYD